MSLNLFFNMLRFNLRPRNTDHQALIKCDPKAEIWRYIDLEKFELLLKDRSLFFCRADKFSDPFEASIPKKVAEYRIKEGLRIPKLYGREASIEEAKKKSENIAMNHRKLKKAFIVNCWHINTTESDAMWRLYLKTNEGVAIQSTCEKLIDSLSQNEEKIFISKVRYIDYDNDSWYHKTEYPLPRYNMFTPIVHKRKAFEHENELRAFHKVEEAERNPKYWDKEIPSWKKYIPLLNQKTTTIFGKNISCDVNKLIVKVILPPTSDKDVRFKVERILKKYDLKKEIKKSKLTDEPNY